MNQSLTGYPSIDKPWLKYHKGPFFEENIPGKSIYQFAFDECSNKMNSVYLDVRSSANGFSKGIKITFGQFFNRVHSCAKAAKVAGVRKDAIIPIILPNIPEARIAIYANSMIGAVSYPISPLLPANQLKQLIEENKIEMVYIFASFLPKFMDVLKLPVVKTIVLVDGTESLPPIVALLKKNDSKSLVASDARIVSWKQFVKNGKMLQENIVPVYEPDRIAAIIGTSGTTGTSKGVCLTDRNINTVACAYRDGDFFHGSFLDALLPSIGYGISMLHYQTVAGKYVYLCPELLTDKFVQALMVLKPDNFPGGPVHSIHLLNSEEFKNGLVPKCENLISGGASLPHEVERQLNKVDRGYAEVQINDDLIVRQGYGLSENVAMGTFSIRGAYKFGAIGIPVPYITMGIFTPGTDEELTYGEQGELCITGPSVMAGYLNNPEETDAVVKLHRDEKKWIHTKDICYMDEDGCIFHVDRIKNIFMRTGFNVHPAKIAEAINDIPFVNNSVVIGFDHPKEQCVPIAFVELKQGTTNTEQCRDTIMRICYDNLEETSVPHAVVFVEKLPINAGGKIDQRKVKAEAGINLMESNYIPTKTISFSV